MNNDSTKITVTDIDIPFTRLVGILLKFMLASIPAVILFYIFFGLLALVFVAIFGGSAAFLNSLNHH